MKIHSVKQFEFDNCIGLIPVLAGLFLYLKTIGFEFTGWDDMTFIADNRSLKSFNIENLMDIIIPGRMRGELIYIPATYFSYLFEVSLFGVQPSVIHFDNLMLHLFNISLVYVLVRMITVGRIIPFFTSLIFAVHPLQVEAVSWCMGRKDLLSTFFALLFLIAFIKYVRQKERNPTLYICSLALFIFSIFSKPSVFPLPLLLPPIMIFINCKINKDMLFRISPFFIISSTSFYINSKLDIIHATSELKYIFYRMTFIPSVLEGWFKRFLLLEKPSAVYEWFSIADGNCIAGTGLILFISLLVLFIYSIYRNIRIVWFGMLFSLLGFLPSLSYLSVSLRDFYTADRYGYFPLIGVFLIISSASCLFSSRAAKITSIIALLIFSFCAGLLSWQQVEMWRNKKNLWEQTLVSRPNSRHGNYGMASENLEKGDFPMANYHIIKAKKAYLSSKAFYIHGLINEGSGCYEDAMINYRRAVSLESGLLIARKRLGLLYSYSGQYEKGLEQFMIIIGSAPQIPETYFYCSRTHQMMGNETMARETMKIFEKLNGSKNNVQDRNALPNQLISP